MIFICTFLYIQINPLFLFSIYSLQLIYQYGYVDKYYLLPLYFQEYANGDLKNVRPASCSLISEGEGKTFFIKRAIDNNRMLSFALTRQMVSRTNEANGLYEQETVRTAPGVPSDLII